MKYSNRENHSQKQSKTKEDTEIKKRNKQNINKKKHNI